MALRDLGALLDVELVAGPGEDRGAQTAVGTVHVVGEPLPDDDQHRLAVLEWRPTRRGGPLPALAPLLRAALQPSEPVALLVACPDRAVNPPDAAITAACAAGVPLLWAPGRRAAAVAVQARELIEDGAADIDLTGEAVGLLEVLAGGVELVGLVARAASMLGGRIVVTGADRVLADEPGDADPALVVVAEESLSHAGDAVGHLSVARADPLIPAEAAMVAALAQVVGLAVRVHLAEDGHEDPARELLTVILGEHLVAREAALRRGRRLQAFPQRRAVVVVVEPFGPPLSRAGMERLARHLQLPLATADERATMVVHEGSVVMLVGADLPLDRTLRALRRRAALPLAVGTSRVVDDIRSLPGAYRQAQRAATLGRRLGRANQITDYDQLGVLRLLYQLPEHERRAFAQEVLGSLVSDDADPDSAAMRGVLHALRSAHGNITEAARHLFIHPNTLRQRIARIESLIGPFLADADRRMTVFVALDLHLLDSDESR